MGHPLENNLYVLDAARDVVPATFIEWATFFEDGKVRQVDLTRLPLANVSTVFLGFDYGHGLTSRPVVFETAIFMASNNPDDGGLRWMKRSCTWAEAQAVHDEAVREALKMHEGAEGAG